MTKLYVAIDVPEDAPPEMVAAFLTGVKNIARAMFGAEVMHIERGELHESIRRDGTGGNSIDSDSVFTVPILHHDNRGDVRPAGGVAGVRTSVAGGHRLRAPGIPGVVRGPALPESGSDRLSGLPEGIAEDDTEEIAVGSHRGRRRRLWRALKRVGAGKHFRR